MIDVIDLQRTVAIDVASIRDFVSLVPGKVPETAGRLASVAFISDRKMRQLNQLFRGKDATTDVLSFPWDTDNSPHGPDGFLGDIVISAEQAQRQAAENGLDLGSEIKQLILHGLLHLCGYDHETDNGEMNKRELALRKKLGIE